MQHITIRNYNEDRITIITGIERPRNRLRENWPKCFFFGLYDGHGGAGCANFLKERLHQFVIREHSFPQNPENALRRGFEMAEKEFLETCQSRTSKIILDKSGSCALVVLIVGDMCYVANVGDSRAILSV